MKFIHELAHTAINNNCAIVTTNMVRNIINKNSVYKTINNTDEPQIAKRIYGKIRIAFDSY